MSDTENASLRYLQERVGALEKEKAQLRSALKEARGEQKGLKAKYDDLASQAEAELGDYETRFNALQAERDEWHEKANAAPDARIAELEGKLRDRDHKDAWTKAVGESLHEKASVDKLWREIDYTPDGDPDPAKITELVGKAKDAAPYLFREPPAAPGQGATPQGGQAKPALKPAAAAGPGARDTASGSVRYSASEVREPGWMTKRPELAEAIAEGTATLVDG